jgi:hypothetical protein
MKETATIRKLLTSSTTYVAVVLVLIFSMQFTIDINNLLGTSNTTQMTTTPATDQPTGDVINTKYLEITNHSFSEDLLFTIVNGTVVNNSDNTINSAEINVQFYDENGTLITSATENARFVILAPGENSTFSVRSDLGDEIVHAYKAMPGGDIQVG